MGRGDSLSACCAFCLCPIEGITEKNKQDVARKVVLEKFYSEFINNSTFNQLKLKKNGEREEDKPADNWTICGECSLYVNRLLGSKAKVDKMEMEVRGLQRRVVEEMKVLLEEVDGMCGEMIMIEGILSNRNINSEAATGRGMRNKCKEFKDRVINILDNLRNFHQEVGDKIVPRDVQKVKVKKATKMSTVKSSMFKKQKKSTISVNPPVKKNAPVTTTTKPELEGELKIEVEEPTDQGDDDCDSWHWSGNGDDPQSPAQNSSAAGLIPEVKLSTKPTRKIKRRKKKSLLFYHSKKKTAGSTSTMTPRPKKIKTNARVPYQEEEDGSHDLDSRYGNNGNDDGPNSPPGQHLQEGGPLPSHESKEAEKVMEDIPAKRARRSRIQLRPNDKEEADFSFSSDSSSDHDSFSDEYDPEDQAYTDVPANKFRKNLISRIRLHNTISTSGCLPTDHDDPRRSYTFLYYSNSKKFFVGDVEVDCLDSLAENAKEPGLGCTQCDYAIYPSEMRHPRDNIEDYIFEHILGKHLGVYNCKTCGQCRSSYHKWKLHQKLHEDADAFGCDICGKPMSGPASLKFHRWTHFSEEEKKDPVNEHWMPLRVRKPNNERNFVCEICGKGFKRKCSLQLHEEIHKSEEEREKLICERCGHSVLACYYDIHKRKHCKPPRDLRCHVCGDGVKNVKDLNEHLVRVHKDEKTYECDVCGERFKTMPYLRHHKEIHEEGEKYLCKYCGKGFKQRKNCGRHENICGGGSRDGIKRGPGRPKNKEDKIGGEGEPQKQEEAGHA